MYGISYVQFLVLLSRTWTVKNFFFESKPPYWFENLFH